jgi:hypothetical protein
MAKQVKPKKSVATLNKSNLKIQKYLIAFPVIALLIKIIVIFNTQSGGWAGADGENYLTGVDGLINQGLFSDQSKLSYFPAGYPLLIWPLAEITITKFLYLLSLIQSLFFAYSTYFFTKALNRTSLAKFAFTASLFISFNPTLSLGSLSVGYETPVAACLMMVCGITIKTLSSEGSLGNKLKDYLYIGLWFSLASFLQPRFLLVGFVFIFILVVFQYGKQLNFKYLAVGIISVCLLPSFLIFRNAIAVDQATISTNLGTTMNLGVGDQALGGYDRIGPAIKCDPDAPGDVVTDNEVVACVMKWYVTNPVKAAKLVFHKSLYFWSPWSGPVANGTMARNPWLKVSPIQKIQTTNEAINLVQGPIGKTVSYLWMFGQLVLFIIGFRYLFKRGKFEYQVAVLIVTPTLLAWLITLGTIGDHRFRVPTMALSLFLQVAGYLAIRDRFTKIL